MEPAKTRTPEGHGKPAPASLHWSQALEVGEVIPSLARETPSTEGARMGDVGWGGAGDDRVRRVNSGEGWRGETRWCSSAPHPVFLELTEPQELGGERSVKAPGKATGHETVDLPLEEVYAVGGILKLFLCERNVLHEHGGMDVEKDSKNYRHDHSPGFEDDAAAAGGQLLSTVQKPTGQKLPCPREGTLSKGVGDPLDVGQAARRRDEAPLSWGKARGLGGRGRPGCFFQRQ